MPQAHPNILSHGTPVDPQRIFEFEGTSYVLIRFYFDRWIVQEAYTSGDDWHAGRPIVDFDAALIAGIFKRSHERLVQHFGGQPLIPSAKGPV